MNRLGWVTCALALFSLTACGSKDTPKVGAEPSSKVPSGDASAEQVAREMRGNVKCPPKASAERPAGAPVDDVVGARPGMPLDEAANFVLCDNPMLVVTENASRGYDINTYGQHVRQGFDAKFAQPRVTLTSEQYLQQAGERAALRSGNAVVLPLQAGQVRYFVSSIGMPGQERVLSVAREEYFPEGKLPTVDSLKQALVAKYGQPSVASDGGALSYLWWEYDPAGRKIAPDAPQSASCRVNASPDSGTSLSEDCGVQIGAMIQAASDNPGLAHALAVTSQNGAQGYAALQRTEDGLRQANESRKSQQLNDASKNAATPKL